MRRRCLSRVDARCQKNNLLFITAAEIHWICYCQQVDSSLLLCSHTVTITIIRIIIRIIISNKKLLTLYAFSNKTKTNMNIPGRQKISGYLVLFLQKLQ